MSCINCTVRTTRWVKLATSLMMLAIIGLAILMLVRAGQTIAGWIG